LGLDRDGRRRVAVAAVRRALFALFFFLLLVIDLVLPRTDKLNMTTMTT
jgi:hypothetical protein